MSAHDQFVLQMGGGLRWLAKRSELNANEVMTLSVLVLVDGPDGCHPSQGTIAEISGLSRGVVSRTLGSLEGKSLISREKRRYWDSRQRERESKEHFYVFSEEVEHALEFAAETLELRRRSTQPSLFTDFPIGSAVDPIGHPDWINSRAGRDHESPSRELQTRMLDFPTGSGGDPMGTPDARDSRSNGDPIGSNADPNRGGGGGKKDQLMTLIRSFTPTTPPNPEERELSMQIMMHPAIAMLRDFAQAIAARWSPREILERCRAYSADYNAEGGAKGVGALIYRFAHFNSIPNREIRDEDLYDYEWYSEFEYLVGLQEGLYEPYPDEEEPDPVIEDSAALEEVQPRPVLVPAGSIAEPDTAAAVFNSLEIETTPETKNETREGDMLSARETEIRTIIYWGQESGRPIDEHRRDELRRELFAIAQQRRREKAQDTEGGPERLQPMKAEQAERPIMQRNGRY